MDQDVSKVLRKHTDEPYKQYFSYYLLFPLLPWSTNWKSPMGSKILPWVTRSPATLCCSSTPAFREYLEPGFLTFAHITYCSAHFWTSQVLLHAFSASPYPASLLRSFQSCCLPRILLITAANSMSPPLQQQMTKM